MGEFGRLLMIMGTGKSVFLAAEFGGDAGRKIKDTCILGGGSA